MTAKTTFPPFGGRKEEFIMQKAIIAKKMLVRSESFCYTNNVEIITKERIYYDPFSQR